MLEIIVDRGIQLIVVIVGILIGNSLYDRFLRRNTNGEK